MMIHVALDFEIFTGMNYFAWENYASSLKNDSIHFLGENCKCCLLIVSVVYARTFRKFYDINTGQIRFLIFWNSEE